MDAKMGTPSPLKIALIQMATGANKASNLAIAAERIKAAANNGASLVVLPECFNSPYGLSSFRKYAEPATPAGPSYTMLSSAAKESKIYLVGGSIPEEGSDKALDGSSKLYNTALVFGPDGSCLATHRKVHLFDIDVPGGVSFKESAVLSAGNQLTSFQTPWGRIGLGICYDIRFPEQTLLAARKEGVSAMLFPGAFNMTTGPLHWELLLRSRALDNQIYVAGCAPARDSTAEYVAWGHSALVDPMGRVIASTEEKEDIVYGTMDSGAIAEARKAIPTSLQRRFDVYPNISAMETTESSRNWFRKRARLESQKIIDWCPFSTADEIMAAVTLYPSVLSRIAAAHPKTKSKLPEMERAYESLRSTSSPKPLSLTDLETVLNWKLVRGTFRPSLMSLIRCNSNDSVIEVTKEALILLKNGNDINTWTLALKELIRLRGVGPATASAILALWTPTVPFYSDEAAHIALGLQKLKYTEKEVMMYVDRMRDCAGQLGVSARDLEVALFVNAHKSLLEDEEAV